jgi:hypothetical protein
MRRHPQVYAPPKKEPRFFDQNWDRGWGWYADNYKQAPSGRLTGDFSPTYASSYKRSTALRIARAYPDAKIIQLIRNPIDCAISNWRMAAENRGMEIPFLQALTEWRVVLDRALFFGQITNFRAHFPDAQIKSVAFVERGNDPTMLTEVQSFLGLEIVNMPVPKASRSDSRRNRPKKPIVSHSDRKTFIEMVAEDANKIVEYAGLPKDFWALTVDYKGWDSGLVRRTQARLANHPYLSRLLALTTC